MRSILSDLRFAFRLQRREPLFSLVVIATLALGIGANSAIFSVVDAVMLRPLPYREASKIVAIQENISKLAPQGVDLPAPDVVDFQQQSSAFESVGGFRGFEMDLTSDGAPERIQALRTSAETFDVLGARPVIGRQFTREEDTSGARVCLISYGFWQSKFGGDPRIAGRTVRLDRQSYTIIGVLPKSFEFPLPGMRYGWTPVKIWTPMSFTKEELARFGDNFDYAVIARLKPGVTDAQALADASAVVARIHDKYPANLRDLFQLSARVTPVSDLIFSQSRSLMFLLTGAVGFVLLIACTNVANLLLGRAAGRRHEIAVRASLGASRGRLVQQFLTESAMLAVAGGIAGAGLAAFVLESIVKALPDDVPRAGQAGLDLTVLLVTLVLAVVCGLILGVIPALSVSRASDLKQGGRGSTARSRVRGALVIAETALSLALLIGAGLLVRSLIALRSVHPGFDATHVIRADVSLPGSAYHGRADRTRFYQRVFENLASMPGIRSNGGVSSPLLATDWNHLFSIRDGEVSSQRTLSSHAIVYGDYFQTMGIRLLEGRLFDSRDRPGSERVVIVNEALEKRFFPGRSAVGHQLKWGAPQSNSPWLTIIGVVGDTHAAGLETEPPAQTYEPYANVAVSELNIVVRAVGDPAALANSLRTAIASVDPEIPITNLETAGAIIDRAVAPQSRETWLLGSFAALALMLAAIGLYGVVSYTVTQRIPEIGIRMALGATRTGVLKFVIARGMVLVLIGIALGLGAALALTRLMTSFLYGIAPRDEVTFFAAPALLLAVAMAANLIPARRAANVDPVIALRNE